MSRSEIEQGRDLEAALKRVRPRLTGRVNRHWPWVDADDAMGDATVTLVQRLRRDELRIAGPRHDMSVELPIAEPQYDTAVECMVRCDAEQWSQPVKLDDYVLHVCLNRARRISRQARYFHEYNGHLSLSWIESRSVTLPSDFEIAEGRAEYRRIVREFCGRNEQMFHFFATRGDDYAEHIRQSSHRRERASVEEIADLVGVSRPTAYRWIMKFNRFLTTNFPRELK